MFVYISVCRVYKCVYVCVYLCTMSVPGTLEARKGHYGDARTKSGSSGGADSTPNC